MRAVLLKWKMCGAGTALEVSKLYKTRKDWRRKSHDLALSWRDLLKEIWLG